MRTERQGRGLGWLWPFVAAGAFLNLYCYWGRITPVRIKVKGVRSYTVQRGDTLGAIYERHGRGYPLAWIYEVKKLSGLKTSKLQPGDRLVLPR